MKALKLTVIAILALTTAALANVDKAGKKESASAEVKANIFAHNNDMVFVQLENPADSKVKIVIVDQDGVTLHSETVKQDLKVLKRFDVSNLPSGQYSYKVSNDTYTVIKKIEKK
ncbi:MAG: T9SS type A sorting domain-containing protein [Reichenbachiella sp.]|uniref:T9SS type A sorting domain-containing protein n=1 Tax=Reichenbachiella sp. TaxID=2184521 RepID=UPI00329975A8